MSKRRNLKKEKAQRNLAYARQFRKKVSQNSRGWGRRRQDNRSSDDNNNQDKEDDSDRNNRFSSGDRF
ncbi:conserved hypothetical protein [Gloeothece citriformis PCC 7424]|uniref:Uncharacterized protein n=1 Tax=Gloeothece citriformis (strain PCC 7424) TaxID=65393 RepID=B7KA03_GLOC7|nr:hypothetical protein [Gloeothece citriformis]ACK71359.1 conserved hypothetical protein [Gloeothece citriformis PCC 7424]